MVKLDLALQARGDYETLLEAARFCEQRGLAALALPDHYLASRSDPSEPAYDALAQLAGLARETSTLELSTLVSPITFRHPSVTLKTAATIDEMSDGRFTLGLGTGWFAEEHELFGIPFPDQRFDMLEDALAYTRAGLEGQRPPGTALSNLCLRDSPETVESPHRRRRLRAEAHAGTGGPIRRRVQRVLRTARRDGRSHRTRPSRSRRSRPRPRGADDLDRGGRRHGHDRRLLSICSQGSCGTLPAASR